MVEEEKEIMKYLFEAGVLKRVKRSGWWIAQVKDPESVAEHVYRTAVVAFILAKLEGANAERICCAALFHDMQETRLLDLHKIHARYFVIDEKIEKTVIADQLKCLPEDIRKHIANLYNLDDKEKTILRDADLLECALQAKEYVEIGYKDCQNWIENIEKVVKTESAKKLYKQLKAMSSRKWWEGLKKLG
jgi:putative hydrolase of HD superfamily